MIWTFDLSTAATQSFRIRKFAPGLWRRCAVQDIGMDDIHNSNTCHGRGGCSIPLTISIHIERSIKVCSVEKGHPLIHSMNKHAHCLILAGFLCTAVEGREAHASEPLIWHHFPLWVTRPEESNRFRWREVWFCDMCKNVLRPVDKMATLQSPWTCFLKDLYHHRYY